MATLGETTTYDYVPSTLVNTIVCTICGMMLEGNMRGIISAATVIAKSGSRPVLWIILVCNLFSILLGIFSILIQFAGQRTCVFYANTANVFWHCYFATFNAFLFQKTGIICAWNRWFSVLATVLLLHRVAWGVFDMISSSGIWNLDDQACEFLQNPTSGYGHLLADILSDVLCTGTTLVILVSNRISKTSKLVNIIWRENMIRTSLILLVQTFLVYATVANQGYWIGIVTSICCYIYGQCINSEFYWRKARTEAILTEI